MADQTNDRIDLLTPEARVSFPNLFEPRKINEDDQTAKYSVTLLFDKKAQATPEYKKMVKAVEKAIKAKWGDNPPRKIKSPFLTVDDLTNKIPDGYEDEHVFVRLMTTVKPDVVDESVQDIIKADEVYGGCYGRAAIHTYAWSHKTGGAGVSLGLDHFQKTRDGEPFTKRSKADDVFAAVDTDDDEDDDDDVL